MLGFRQVAFCSCLRVILLRSRTRLRVVSTLNSDGVTWDANAKEYDIDADTEHLPNGVKSFYYVADEFDVPEGRVH